MEEKLAQLICQLQDANGCHGYCTKCNELAKNLAAAGVTVQKWIPVSERLPEESGFWFDDMKKAVLIYTPVDGCMHIGWYTGKDYRGRDTWNTLTAMRSAKTCTKKVTHWMPLPEPPKGE